jgi:hypothetical protein
MKLMQHQLDAIELLGSGKVLYGSVGSGKTLTALGYYMKKESPRDIYVFTTAKVRDSLTWEGAAATLGIGKERDATLAGIIKVDSWNNIEKYLDIKDCFVILDEQRLVGHGAWVKAFLKIAKKNRWIMLSATPGDTWLDYAPLFISNGFYRNITQFKFEHVLYEPYTKYPKIRMYLNETKLEVLRNDILVEMPYLKNSKLMLNWTDVGHDKEIFRRVFKDRWNVYEDRPVKDVAELFRLMRKVVNSDPSRLEMVRDLMKVHPRLIIFYNYNFELEILRTLYDEIEVGEWNGHQKDPLPESARWVYLVQYVAGGEGWNCTATDAMILYSLTYSYKNFIQAQGRIDRLDTTYDTLFVYALVSNSKIDLAIKDALSSKKAFNKKRFLGETVLLEKV